MTVVPVLTKTSNDKKAVRVYLYFYLIDSSGNSTSYIDDATTVKIVVKEEVYIKRLLGNPFLDTDASDQDQIVTSFPDEVVDMQPYHTVIIEEEDTETIDSLSYAFVTSFDKSEESRNFTFKLQNPNEFSNYTISESLIIAIFERFNDVEIDLGSYNTPTYLPSKSFSNDTVIFKNASLTASSCDFFGRKNVKIENCIFNKYNDDIQNYITFSSNNEISLSYIELQSAIYVKNMIHTSSETEYNTSKISITDVKINVIDNSTTTTTRDALISASGCNDLIISDIKVNYDLPGYRILSIDSVNTFNVSDYNHVRSQNVGIQDFMISQFFEGTFIDVYVEGPKDGSMNRSTYAVICGKMRIEAKLNFTNCKFYRYGAGIFSYASFNTLNFLNSYINDCTNSFDFNKSNINTVSINGSTLRNIGSVDLDLQSLKLVKSAIISKDTVNLYIAVNSSLSDSQINAVSLNMYLRENSTNNLSTVTFEATSSIKITNNRPSTVIIQSEELTLNTVKLKTPSLIISDILKLICNTVSLEDVGETTLEKLDLIFSDFTIDYANKTKNLIVKNCTLSNSKFNLKNTPQSYSTEFNNCTGDILFSYYNDDSTITCKHKLILKSSVVEITTEETFGTHIVSINSKGGAGSKYISEGAITISPDVLSADSNIFSKASAKTDTDSTKFLYGVFEETA